MLPFSKRGSLLSYPKANMEYDIDIQGTSKLDVHLFFFHNKNCHIKPISNILKNGFEHVYKVHPIGLAPHLVFNNMLMFIVERYF